MAMTSLTEFEKFWERYANEFDWDEKGRIKQVVLTAWLTAWAESGFRFSNKGDLPDEPDDSLAIMGAFPGAQQVAQYVDHINEDPRDNTLSNLRIIGHCCVHEPSTLVKCWKCETVIGFHISGKETK